MAESIEHLRCKMHACEVFSGYPECPLPPGYRADFCGVVKGHAIYAEVDCKRIGHEMLCWISVYDHSSDRLLKTWPCPCTPLAIWYPREIVIGMRECLSCDQTPIRNRALRRQMSSQTGASCRTTNRGRY